MADKIKYLLSDRNAFARMHGRVGSMADRRAQNILMTDPDLDRELLRQALVIGLELYPLEVGEPTSIRIHLQRKPWEFGDPRYLHQAVVPYTGSRALWQAQPSRTLPMMLAGNASETAVTLDASYELKEFERFEHFVRWRLDDVRTELPKHDAPIAEFNAILPDFSRGWLNGRTEELVYWRRRARQIREREERRRALEESEEPIAPEVPEWKRRVAELIKAQRSRG